MSILLDHCVPRRYLHLLRAWGYTAELSIDYIPESAVDADVIALAQTRNAVLLTVDLDFANILDYPPSAYGGIIVLRYQLQDENALDSVLKTALDDLYRDTLGNTLVIVSPKRYRLRR